MKILTVIIVMLALAACSAEEKTQPNYQIPPTTVQATINKSTNKEPVLTKETKKNPFPKHYYPVPHNVTY